MNIRKERSEHLRKKSKGLVLTASNSTKGRLQAISKKQKDVYEHHRIKQQRTCTVISGKTKARARTSWEYTEGLVRALLGKKRKDMYENHRNIRKTCTNIIGLYERGRVQKPSELYEWMCSNITGKYERTYTIIAGIHEGRLQTS